MSKLTDYMNKIEKDVELWPSWKKKNLKESLQLSKKAHSSKSSSQQKNIVILATN